MLTGKKIQERRASFIGCEEGINRPFSSHLVTDYNNRSRASLPFPSGYVFGAQSVSKLSDS
jgi:hypothetical protein